MPLTPYDDLDGGDALPQSDRLRSFLQKNITGQRWFDHIIPCLLNR